MGTHDTRSSDMAETMLVYIDFPNDVQDIKQQLGRIVHIGPSYYVSCAEGYLAFKYRVLDQACSSNQKADLESPIFFKSYLAGSHSKPCNL